MVHWLLFAQEMNDDLHMMNFSLVDYVAREEWIIVTLGRMGYELIPLRTKRICLI